MALTIIDNYDSFTFNLYQILAEATGEAPRVIRNDASWSEFMAVPVDGVILSPGPGRPDVERDFGLCARVIQEVSVPILGVCLGHQGIGFGFGSRVIEAPEVMHGRASVIHHDGDALFAGIPPTFEAVRYHSLIIDELPSELERTAWTDDGLIMGIRHRQRPIWGIQFHPESIGSHWGRRLLSNFARMAGSTQSNMQRSQTVAPPQRATTPTHEVIVHKLQQWVEPEYAFAGCLADMEHAWWLDSNDANQQGPRYSYMGAPCGPESEWASYDVFSGNLTVCSGQNRQVSQERISNWLVRRLSEDTLSPTDVPFDLCGGYVGYLGYEYKAACGAQPQHRSKEPDGWFVRADHYLVFDHVDRACWLVALCRPEHRPAAVQWVHEMTGRLTRVSAPGPVSEPASSVSLKLSRSRDRYLSDIRSCFDELHRGESYEVCLTTHLRGPAICDPLSYYRRLRQLNPAPYSAYLRVGQTVIACSSPERFIRIDAEGQVEARPIKGTRPRGRTAEEDQSIAQELMTAPKDRSENLMIVDLLRNDLGRVCAVGTVHVPELMVVEQYATVHQLVSSIQGKLNAGLTAVDCIGSAFPGGSMTGAPKLRTMEIIDRLEGEARGIYSGAIGYFSASGAADFNIVIRTAICRPDEVTIGVGGAIVALSDAEDEFEEILLKGAVLAKAMGAVIEDGAHKHIPEGAASS